MLTINAIIIVVGLEICHYFKKEIKKDRDILKHLKYENKMLDSILPKRDPQI